MLPFEHFLKTGFWRGMAPKWLTIIPATLMLGPVGWAADDQVCGPSDLAVVDAWLAKHPWKIGKTSPDALDSAACKRSPADINVLIVVAAYAQGGDDKNSIVALVDRRARVVLAANTGVIGGDVMTRVGGFRIDTARYDLAHGVRAFGVDSYVMGQASRVSDFVRSGPERTLFIRQGTDIKPVLSAFSLTTWNAVPDRERGETSHWTIAVGKTHSHGFSDLVVTRTTEPDIDGTPALVAHSVLHFNGMGYGDANASGSAPLGPRPGPPAPILPMAEPR